MGVEDAAINTQPLLSVRDLRIEFPLRRGTTLVAVDGISFDVKRGEILGIVGESGAGKSLTGQSVIGLLEAPGRIAGGKILLDGQRIDNLAEAEMKKLRGARIGMVFQDPLTSLNPLYRVGAQIVETIRTHLNVDEATAQERAVSLLREVGLPAAEQRMSAYPHQLSGGMRQRVVIALALCAEPELVIADEPTTALDVSVQTQVIQVLKQSCAERGAAVVLITHDMGVVAEIADRVAVMYAGCIAEIGPVAQVIRRPRHPYTVGLMGTIPHLRADVASLVQVPGVMPRLTAIPQGCAFHPRCPHTFEHCTRERPMLTQADETATACWLWTPEEEVRNGKAANVRADDE